MANKLDFDKKVMAVAMGNSIRSIERMTGIHHDTILRLGVRMGQGCKAILDDKMHDLDCKRVQVDEIWGFIGVKQKTVVREHLDRENGDIWTWIAIDADTKIVPTFAVGDRSKYMADTFIADLASRLRNRIQLSSDSLPAYRDAVERAFGSEVDYGTVVKTFTHADLQAQRRYSPPEVVTIKREVVQGEPDEKAISTSYIEKQNHTLRMHCRRLTRLTNAFSKKRENFEAAIALHYGYYNFCKRHTILRCTPAQEAGIESSQWTTAELDEQIEGR